MHAHTAAHKLDHQIAAVRVMDHQVLSERIVQQRLGDIGNRHALRPHPSDRGVPDRHRRQRLRHLRHGPTCAEEPAGQVDEVDYRLGGFLRRGGGQVGFRQPERAYRQARLIETIAEGEVESETVHADKAKLVGPLVGGGSCEGGRG